MGFAFIGGCFLACVALTVMVMSCRPAFQSLNSSNSLNLSYEPRRTPQSVAPQVRELSDEDRHGFLQVWWSIREHYEDDPTAAVKYADLLISDLMEDCGRPVRLDHRSHLTNSDLRLTSRFCAAHQLTDHIQRGRFTQDELEHAMSLYATLLEELLG